MMFQGVLIIAAVRGQYRRIPYRGLFLLVEIFVKCWIRSSEIIFVVLSFVAPAFVLTCYVVGDDVISKFEEQTLCFDFCVSATLLRQ